MSEALTITFFGKNVKQTRIMLSMVLTMTKIENDKSLLAALMTVFFTM